jgi:hypothetical protein
MCYVLVGCKAEHQKGGQGHPGGAQDDEVPSSVNLVAVAGFGLEVWNRDRGKGYAVVFEARASG